jgi:hypothetical protein
VPPPATGPTPAPLPQVEFPSAEVRAALSAFPAALDAAFDRGAAAGFRFLAAHSWPDGFAADALLACLTPEPTPTYAQLDARRYRQRVEFRPVSLAPGFLYPPTGEYPADSGLTVVLGRLIVTTEERGEDVGAFDDIGRMAVRPDGSVVLFPMCFPFLPGEILAHRVTDGDVGGYTDAEAEGDIRLLFGNSPPSAQAEACERFTARDLAALEYMLMAPDLDGTDARMSPRVIERTLTELCAARVS